MTLLWKLLREHISVSQLSGFFLSNLIGTTIVLLTAQLLFDLVPLFGQGDSLMKREYLVVAKEVSTVGSLLGKSHTFSQAEIERVESQPFARNVGQFTSSQFDIYVSLTMPDSDLHISSDIFFESVPDNYIDVATERWHFSPGDTVIPIIMPRNYLNLYNFGFSQGRGLPKLSEGAISLINLDVRIRGRHSVEKFKANIVGFSDRLNTILVPESFLEWANPTFAPGQSLAPSRLIVEVDNPADENIATFFAQNRYTTEDNKLDTGKIAYLLRFAILIVMVVGLFISLLSIYILMLSIFLLLEKSGDKLRSLLLIGYSPREVARPYQLLTASVNMVILLLSVAAVATIRHHYIDVIDTLFPQGDLPSLLPSILIGVALMGGVTLLNAIVISRKVDSIW